jgi:8-oxo-dGTP diphosphatase
MQLSGTTHMNRRFGEAIRHHTQYRTRPGAYAVILKDDRVLLTFQARPQAEFQLPGGGIDPGESPLRALHREVLEETGWRIAPVRRLGVYRRFTYMPDYDIWARKSCQVYLARAIRPVRAISEPWHSAHLLSAEAALDAISNDGDRHFLATSLRDLGLAF